MKAVKFIFLLLSFIILFLTFTLYNIKNQKFIAIDSFKILEDNSEEVVLSCDFNIYNPNWFRISTKDVIFKLYSDSIFLGNGKLNHFINLPHNDTVLVSSTINIKKNIFNSFNSFEDSVSLNVLGSSSIPFLSKRYYFNFSEKINLAEYLSVFASNFSDNLDLKINDINIRKIDFKKTYLDVGFRIYNKSMFECRINKLDVEVYESERYMSILAVSKIKDRFILKPDTYNDFKSSVELNTLKMAGVFFTNTLKNKSSLFIKANAMVSYNNIEIPFSTSKKINFNPLTFEIY